MNPETIVQAQVVAYNNRDIEAFAACHAEDVELYNFGKSLPFVVGNPRLKEVYGDVFENSPTLHAEIINRIVFDNKVIDHEVVTGRKGIDRLEIIAIYEVENDLISKAHFIRK